MDIEIKNGAGGPDIGARVDENSQLKVFSISETEIQDAVEKGNAYNINTGEISLANANSAVLYFKNDEAPINGESTIKITSMIVGIKDDGTTVDELPVITLIRNPTGGTIVSGASAVANNVNRNFGSSKALGSTTLAYKGAAGNTLTGGTDFGIIYQPAGTRVAYPIDIELPRGAAMGVEIDANTSSGNTNVYVALIMHRKDGNNG